LKINYNIFLLHIIRTMVKNAGGNKSKKMGRKFLTAPIDKKIRLAQEDGEIYAVVTKNLGNGMFYANNTDGRELLCIMRQKFKGRGKRDNTVNPGGWVLVGVREFESCAKPKHDLLEVYTDIEKQKLKNSGNPIFSKLRSEFDKGEGVEEEEEAGVSFEQDDSSRFQDLLEEVNETTTTHTAISGPVIMDDEGEEVDFDDI
jgi:translation initiation factor IF-1